jgi:alkanesulfonate monooxygenase SsuD/methylene tetrahydromethanopterin reductase-like flavin-dependent oxidoreductase (luciferase family)
MKFAHFSHVWNKPGMTPAQRYQQLWDELALCDEEGFDYAVAVEHHFRPYEALMPTPSVYCAAAAAHTKRLRIGPMGYIVPLYDPLRILEEAAVLDNVLGGRLELGLVSGIAPDYFEPYHADYANRRAITHEALALVRTAFSAEGRFSYDGEFHQYHDLQLSVRPLQKPHPPIWIESRDPQTLQLLAQEGVHTGYVFFTSRTEVAPRYREYLSQWQRAGHPDKPNTSYWSLMYVDETDELAVERVRPHIEHAFTKVFGVREVDGVLKPQLAENAERRGDHAAAEVARHITDVDYLLERNLIFVGSPSTVARNIRRAAEEGMINTLLCELNFGFMSDEELKRSITLFGSQVIPALRAFEPF